MSGIGEYGIQSISPQYDVNNSYYVYTSEGYRRAVEEIETEKRESTEPEIKTEKQTFDESGRLLKLEQLHRENEKLIISEIKLKEYEKAINIKVLEEYNTREEITIGTNVDLLA